MKSADMGSARLDPHGYSSCQATQESQRMNKISTKLMLVFVLISGIPLIISTLISINSSRIAIRTEVENTLNTIADYKVLQIQDCLDKASVAVSDT